MMGGARLSVYWQARATLVVWLWTSVQHNDEKIFVVKHFMMRKYLAVKIFFDEIKIVIQVCKKKIIGVSVVKNS